jgi:hypothetical protein
MTRPASLSASGLRALNGRHPNDFSFVVDESSYSCPSFVAEFLSPRLLQVRTIDPTVQELRLEISDPDQHFSLRSSQILFHLALAVKLNLPLSAPLSCGRLLRNWGILNF